VRQAPRLPQANYFLGVVLFEQKRTEEARAALERELALDARCSACMAKLAHVAYLAGDDRQCESWLAKAAALEPDHLETNLVAGMLDLRTGRYQQAIGASPPVVGRAVSGLRQAQYPARPRLPAERERREGPGAPGDLRRLIQEQKAKSIGVRGE